MKMPTTLQERLLTNVIAHGKKEVLCWGRGGGQGMEDRQAEGRN